MNLERLRVQEKTTRLQTEALVSGLHVLNECDSVNGMYREILDCLYNLIEFDSAAILTEEGDGCLSTVVSSDNRLQIKRVPVQGVFHRCLAGRATVLTDLSRVANWPEQVYGLAAQDIDVSNSNVATLKSALLVALPSLSARMILICASENTSGFKRSDLQLLISFTPLATQAVRRAIEMENLSYLVTTLDHQAHFDILTGLPNRTYLEQKLETLDQTEQGGTVMFLDLDNFKSINDTFGHAVGDILLSEIAFRMSAVIGVGDSVARLGGDEFALIVQSEQTLKGITDFCHKLLDAIRRPLFIRNSRIVPSASIGVLFGSKLNLSSQLQMQMADIAMYYAKKKGRNQFCFFNDEMQAIVQQEFEIESQLPLAIRQRQFHLVYQPIASANSLAFNRVEVLVRWGDESTRSYGPDIFIPIAEKTGAIVDLGRWITQQALEEFSSWLNQSNENVLSINVSQIQLQRKDFADGFIKQISDVGVDWRQIELELSENIIVTCINQVVSENILKLKQAGIQFAFDDFGTGNSSLLHLQKFPGTCLKIDKSFIDDVAENTEQRRLVAGMIDFAHHMHMHIVAEGVETRAQMDVLTELGADYLQGYFLAKPAPVDTTLEFLGKCFNSQPYIHDQVSGF